MRVLERQTLHDVSHSGGYIALRAISALFLCGESQGLEYLAILLSLWA